MAWHGVAWRSGVCRGPTRGKAVSAIPQVALLRSPSSGVGLRRAVLITLTTIGDLGPAAADGVMQARAAEGRDGTIARGARGANSRPNRGEGGTQGAKRTATAATHVAASLVGSD